MHMPHAFSVFWVCLGKRRGAMNIHIVMATGVYPHLRPVVQIANQLKFSLYMYLILN